MFGRLPSLSHFEPSAPWLNWSLHVTRMMWSSSISVVKYAFAMSTLVKVFVGDVVCDNSNVNNSASILVVEILLWLSVRSCHKSPIETSTSMYLPCSSLDAAAQWAASQRRSSDMEEVECWLESFWCGLAISTLYNNAYFRRDEFATKPFLLGPTCMN